jgi:hypothetical protein
MVKIRLNEDNVVAIALKCDGDAYQDIRSALPELAKEFEGVEEARIMFKNPHPDGLAVPHEAVIAFVFVGKTVAAALAKKVIDRTWEWVETKTKGKVKRNTRKKKARRRNQR